MTDIRAAAETIASARRNRTPLEPLAGDAAPRTEAEGYLIQDALHGLLAADFGARVGYKIGCTSAVMQQYLDIPHPCGGGVFAKGVHQSGVSADAPAISSVSASNAKSPSGSRAICCRREAPFTAEWVAEAIEAYLPAIEIVDDRYVEWETLGAPTLVADDFFAAGCVLGKPVARSAAPDLLEVVGRAVINGDEAGQGTGADVLGHPHQRAGLARQPSRRRGQGPARGRDRADRQPGQDGVAQAGDSVVMELAGLGSVAATFI